MTWQQIVKLVVTIGIIGSALTFFEYIKRFFAWSWQWLGKPWGSERPARRINFVMRPDQNLCYWQEGGRGTVPHMIVVCGLHVTNAGPAQRGQIVDVYIRNPHTGTSTYLNPDTFYPNGLARDVIFNFEVAPPVVRSGQNFVAAVVVVDQFGGQSVVEVTFRPEGAGAWARMAQGS